MSTESATAVQPLSITVLGNDERGNLTGSASGESCREILRNLAQMATEQQAQQILARVGRFAA